MGKPIDSEILRDLERALTGSEGSEPEDANFSFSSSAKIVSETLQGATISNDNRTVTIIETSPFPIEDIHLRKTFQSAQDEPPGTVSAVRYRGNALLPNITVGGRGLVSLKGISIIENDQSVLITKPTEISRILGIDSGNKQLYIDDLDSKQFSLRNATEE